MKPLTVGGLFSGVGGFELGLQRAGMEITWMVEINPFCRKVLDKHWPDIPKYTDVREVGKHNLPKVDLLCGGFPCQGISKASKGKGLDDDRSGLWYEYQRIIDEMRPRWVIIENVKNILNRGFEKVLAGLWEIGYDAEWSIISACSFGAPHTRERMFIVAYPHGQRREGCNANQGWVGKNDRVPKINWAQNGCSGWTDRTGVITRNGNWEKGDGHRFTANQRVPTWPEAKSEVDRIAYGVPNGVDRLGALGNAVMPQPVEMIGRRIIEVESR